MSKTRLIHRSEGQWFDPSPRSEHVIVLLGHMISTNIAPTGTSMGLKCILFTLDEIPAKYHVQGNEVL